MCKIGVCEWCLPVNGATAVELASEIGFEGIQISDLGGASNGYPMNDPFIQASYLQAASEHNIMLHSLHPYGLQRDGTMLFPEYTSKGEAARESIRQCVRACADMKIPNLMLSSFFDTLIRNRWELDVYAQHLKYAVQYGAEYGIRITYECILPLPQIYQTLDIVGSELTFCYDLINPIRYTFCTPEELFDIGLERIDHFHIKDLPKDLKGYCPIGEGAAHSEPLVKKIIEQGYHGWFISENYYTLQSANRVGVLRDIAKRDVQILRKWFG